MLLETLDSFLTRLKKRKKSSTKTLIVWRPNKKSALAVRRTQSTTPSNDIKTSAYPSNASDPNVRPSHEAATTPASAPHFFPGAQNFVINNSTMIAQTINSGGTVQQLIAHKRIPGAEFNSSARDPPPKCHPDTRKGLRGRIVHWFTDANRHWRMFWIMGPAGVGKSAVAQTIAEEFEASGHLGASLFFSRPNQRDDPDGVIPTLVHQLAVKYPEYKHIVNQRLVDDSTILEKNRRTQFKELIIEPFQILMTRRSQIVQRPLLIILDGLDECDDEEAQCEFIELISDHVRQVENFPLLWMICSRPEWHLKGLLSHPDFQITCEREELVIDDTEAQQDVIRVLRAGFRDIYQKYRDRLEPGWPSETQLRKISAISSGLFAFASTIVKFVGDKYRANPGRQLDLCILFLDGSTGSVNPLHALDLLYHRILSDVPEDVLRTTMRILGLSIMYSDTRLTAHTLANFLFLDQATFYRSLQRLHSVLDIPPAEEAHVRRLHFYHASFGDYLVDPHRSGSLSINLPITHHDVAINSLKWQSRSSDPPAKKQKLAWVHSSVEQQKVYETLKEFSWNFGWTACCHVPDTDAPKIVAELEHFDFRDVGQPPRFPNFLAWLSKLGDQNTGVITKTFADIQLSTDRLFIRHYTNEVGEFMSAFGWSRAAISAHPGDFKLRLRLGRAGKARDIVMEVIEGEPGDDMPKLQTVSHSSDDYSSEDDTGSVNSYLS